MKKLLFVPGFAMTSQDYKISLRNFEVQGIKEYSELTKDMVKDADIVLAHSLGCLEICEFIKKNRLYSQSVDKVILYNPIIESNLASLLKKTAEYRLKNITDQRITDNNIISWKNGLMSPLYTVSSFKKIINTSIDYKIDLYKKYKNIYLSQIDFFSHEYRDRLKCKDIYGNHNEIVYNPKKIFDIILKGK